MGDNGNWSPSTSESIGESTRTRRDASLSDRLRKRNMSEWSGGEDSSASVKESSLSCQGKVTAVVTSLEVEVIDVVNSQGGSATGHGHPRAQLEGESELQDAALIIYCQ